jgi:hypothetical protein
LQIKTGLVTVLYQNGDESLSNWINFLEEVGIKPNHEGKQKFVEVKG